MYHSLQPDRALVVSATGEKAVTVSGISPDEIVAWIEKRLGEDFAIEPATWGPATPGHHRWELNGRELSILRLIAQGRSNQQIARELFLSLNTIKSYIRAAYRKIGVTTRPQALLWGVRRGLDAPEVPDVPDRPAEPSARRLVV